MVHRANLMAYGAITAGHSTEAEWNLSVLSIGQSISVLRAAPFTQILIEHSVSKQRRP